MKIKQHLKERSLFFTINIVLYVFFSVCLYFLDIKLIIIFGVFLIWFLPLSVYIAIEYSQKSRFYNEVIRSLQNIDKKYLLCEVVESPGFLEGNIIHEVLKNIKDDTHETINYYEEKQSDYREYIEVWIHEIKTPIASIRLILENNKSEVNKNILQEIDLTEGFIEQALYYAKSNDTGKDYIIKAFNLGDIIRSVIRNKSRDFIYKKINLNINNIDQEVYSDTKWLAFIINQIITNSIKYSRGDNAHIKIYSKKKKDNIVLTIEDNGVGIVVEDVDQVFEKGFTGNNGRIYGKSTGMGLYICKKLADKLGLGIYLESEESKGTKVSIVFPLGRIALLES